MTCVDIRPASLDRIAAPSPAPTVRARQPGHRWWRWLAASAVLSPGGAMAYELLTRPADGHGVLHTPSPRETLPAVSRARDRFGG